MIEFVTAPAALPPGQRVYAMGDIHGCHEQLTTLHAMIADDLAARPVETCVLLHLGDYIDRGAECAEVIDTLIAERGVPGVEVINLVGNHEDMMLTALSGGQTADGTLWLRNGGADSLLSWRIPRNAPQQTWGVLIPPEHQQFVRGLRLTHRVGPYLFVHAGLRPGVPQASQKREDLLWIREPFLSSKKDHGAVVVHGHTPTREPIVRANRIGIDTGAVLGGVLTCAVLELDKVGFLRA